MVRNIDVDDVKRMMKDEEDLVIIDALPPKAFHTRHLPDAINVPTGADNVDDLIKERVPENKETPIIVYCADEDCEASPQLAHMLEEHHGYTNVHEFAAGIKGWHRAGMEFERPAAEPKPV